MNTESIVANKNVWNRLT